MSFNLGEHSASRRSASAARASEEAFQRALKLAKGRDLSTPEEREKLVVELGRLAARGRLSERVRLWMRESIILILLIGLGLKAWLGLREEIGTLTANQASLTTQVALIAAVPSKPTPTTRTPASPMPPTATTLPPPTQTLTLQGSVAAYGLAGRGVSSADVRLYILGEDGQSEEADKQTTPGDFELQASVRNLPVVLELVVQVKDLGGKNLDRWKIVTYSEGWEPVEGQPNRLRREVPPPGDLGKLEVAMGQPAYLAGNVYLKAAGQMPLAEATVACEWQADGATDWVPCVDQPATTDPSGRFEFDRFFIGAESATYRLKVDAPLGYDVTMRAEDNGSWKVGDGYAEFVSPMTIHEISDLSLILGLNGVVVFPQPDTFQPTASDPGWIHEVQSADRPGYFYRPAPQAEEPPTTATWNLTLPSGTYTLRIWLPARQSPTDFTTNQFYEVQVNAEIVVPAADRGIAAPVNGPPAAVLPDWVQAIEVPIAVDAEAGVPVSISVILTSRNAAVNKVVVVGPIRFDVSQ